MRGLESFDPRLIEIWTKGSTQTVTLKFPKRSLATRFRKQLYVLRKALEHERHPAAASANRTTVRLIEADAAGNYWLSIEPEGSEFNSILDDAGIKMPDVPEIDI